jgi:hypothetical protein
MARSGPAAPPVIKEGKFAKNIPNFANEYTLYDINGLQNLLTM